VTPLPTLVLASGNAGKLREFAALIGDRFRLVPQSEFGIDPPAETGTTFLANALLKAHHAAALSGQPALADDSGLEVDALNGAPGVWSARYGGPGATDADNNSRLLAALAAVPPARRTARYRCVLVMVRSDADPAPLVTEASWEGRIAEAPRGAGGFGYDPIFIDGESGLTGAELDPGAKNARSHRAKALGELVTAIAAGWPGD
jgi:XTP/dITP diphosphohydrolase